MRIAISIRWQGAVSRRCGSSPGLCAEVQRAGMAILRAVFGVPDFLDAERELLDDVIGKALPIGLIAFFAEL